MEINPSYIGETTYSKESQRADISDMHTWRGVIWRILNFICATTLILVTVVGYILLK